MGKHRREIPAKRLFGFAEVIGNRHLVAATVGPHSDLVILSLEGEPDYRVERPEGIFPKRRAGRRNRFRLHYRADDGVWGSLDLPETVENYHTVQPLGEDAWLLVRGRADSEGDRNVHVHDAHGRHLRSFHAGDGIQDVQTARDGTSWVGYFDEGVFGNTSLGQAGLVRLDAMGNCSLEYNGLAGGRVPGIDDCYALNVASDREVWLCYYTDSPLVKLVAHDGDHG